MWEMKASEKLNNGRAGSIPIIRLIVVIANCKLECDAVRHVAPCRNGRPPLVGRKQIDAEKWKMGSISRNRKTRWCML